MVLGQRIHPKLLIWEGKTSWRCPHPTTCQSHLFTGSPGADLAAEWGEIPPRACEQHSRLACLPMEVVGAHPSMPCWPLELLLSPPACPEPALHHLRSSWTIVARSQKGYRLAECTMGCLPWYSDFLPSPPSCGDSERGRVVCKEVPKPARGAVLLSLLYGVVVL